ncbi:hypothetical protein Gasu2_58000 [Galdieria sulphuraria]|uniref:Uncharacterized protein n=1 Tax=Galdieria sulphuraria TaxID=130081 RepID=M2VT78_GALSU|nr:uncharacterized protein Gasu_59890 [Galdieria sulphuraria]EME26371.1 hypothetical protein Gasu_59890 [Galdieria sulphuraria]GJD11672.1 hypothetical protein Gasu2_58000 [Galdieria sulphuraria]|eukprot:XP_005702891.1 hypothetical protein Gasu_59890 [Galdieria sulphuraria]
MDTDSESSDFATTAIGNNKSAVSQKPTNKKKEQSPNKGASEKLSLSDTEEKENFPLLLGQGVTGEQESDQEYCEELNSRPSRRSAVKAQGKMTQVQASVSDMKESSSRRKRDSKVLEEPDCDNDDEDESFSTNDTEDSAFDEDDSEDSSLIDDKLKKGKKRRDSTSCSKKTPNPRASKAKGNQSTQKKNVKSTATSTRAVKNDTNCKSKISVKPIRSGLSSNNQTELESSHSSRLLHVRPIRAGLSKKSPIPRLHSSFLNHS